MSVSNPETIAAKIFEQCDGQVSCVMEAVSYLFIDHYDCGMETVAALLNNFGPEMKEEFISSVGKYARDNGLGDCLQG